MDGRRTRGGKCTVCDGGGGGCRSLGIVAVYWATGWHSRVFLIVFISGRYTAEYVAGSFF